MSTSLGQLEVLIGTAPDPVGDRGALLVLRDGRRPTHELAERLRVQDRWRQSPLRTLLPGLTLVNPTLFRYRLGVRAASPLERTGVSSWAELGDLSPEAIQSLSGIGIEAVDGILIAASQEWATAYLAAARDHQDDRPPPKTNRERLLRLFGRAPDPAIDQQLLTVLRKPDHPDTRWLARMLHTEPDLRHMPLRELMPGLGLVEATDFSVRLSVRAANCLGRAECITLSTLAALTPEKILDLPSVGTNVAEEIFSVAASEWAASYLTATERALRDRSAGVASDDRGSINVAARDLADALAEVEAIGGFIAFRRRRLDIDNPTQSKVAMELGVSGSRVSRLERAVHSKLSRKLRDNDWAITKAVSSLRERLGSLALLNDLDDILAAIDPAGAVLSDDLPHRRVLLLDLAGYQVSGQWVLGPEIESLTQAILSDLTKEGQVDIESARQSLVRLGIKEVIQLPWIINQPDFRVVDGKLLRVSVE